MKTIRIFQSKTLRFLSLFVGAITVLSCGSYQNSSYYDNDGIYGSDSSENKGRSSQSERNYNTNNVYAQQFKNMKEDFVTSDILVDVDSYNTNTDTVYIQENTSRYGGWGENQTNNNTIIINDNWGMNGWGMNGWGMNGWGMNGWGWNGWGMNGWYGVGRNIAINNGPRGGYINNNGNSGRNSGRIGNNIGNSRTQIGQSRSDSYNSPRTLVSDPRTVNPRNNTNTGTPRAIISDPRTYNPRGNTSGTPRNITEPKNDTPRNDAPRSISTPRSSDFGGGRSSGGFGGGGSMGGGRSGGGGRGGR